jgi:hypothetical protein
MTITERAHWHVCSTPGRQPKTVVPTPGVRPAQCSPAWVRGCGTHKHTMLLKHRAPEASLQPPLTSVLTPYWRHTCGPWHDPVHMSQPGHVLGPAPAHTPPRKHTWGMLTTKSRLASHLPLQVCGILSLNSTAVAATVPSQRQVLKHSLLQQQHHATPSSTLAWQEASKTYGNPCHGGGNSPRTRLRKRTADKRPKNRAACTSLQHPPQQDSAGVHTCTCSL